MPHTKSSGLVKCLCCCGAFALYERIVFCNPVDPFLERAGVGGLEAAKLSATLSCSHANH